MSFRALVWFASGLFPASSWGFCLLPWYPSNAARQFKNFLSSIWSEFVQNTSQDQIHLLSLRFVSECFQLPNWNAQSLSPAGKSCCCWPFCGHRIFSGENLCVVGWYCSLVLNIWRRFDIRKLLRFSDWRVLWTAKLSSITEGPWNAIMWGLPPFSALLYMLFSINNSYYW